MNFVYFCFSFQTQQCFVLDTMWFSIEVLSPKKKRSPISKIIWPWCKARCSIKVTIPSNERMGILWILLISMVRETDLLRWSLRAVCKCSDPSHLNMPAMAESSATLFLTFGAGSCGAEIGFWGKRSSWKLPTAQWHGLFASSGS